MHVPNPYYVLKVSYTYNKKIYVINSSNIYFKLNQVSNFIPVFIDPNNPSKAYVDIDYLKWYLLYFKKIILDNYSAYHNTNN